ncbi:unnamed protein product [Rhizophagus irregularis]|nr:unnamed protein product [Rhizophagus irregularis]
MNFKRKQSLMINLLRKLCEECQQICFATLYCEHCVRTYLKNNFSNWTSGNYYIDDLIQKCQLESLRPDQIIEWIPYDNLQNIEYISSKVYSADWIDGRYYIWDPELEQLKRFGMHKVILKRLINVNNANENWFEEAKSNLTISNKYSGIVRFYGLTQDPSNNKDYMLVMYLMDKNLKSYLQQHKFNGIRPKIVSSIPLHYEKLMKQCWDADPLKRPNTATLRNKIKKMWGDSYNDDNEFDTLEYNDSSQLSQVNNSKLSSSSKISSLSASKLYQFENLPEPRNATEAFHSKSYVPVDNMKEFDNDR